jgi:hypothetical protein
MKAIEKTMPTNLRLPISFLNRINRIAKQKKTTKAEVSRYLMKKGKPKIKTKKKGKKKMNETVELNINGVTYVPKGTLTQKAESLNGLEYKIVRTQSAGVFAGYLKSRNGQEVVMLKARRIFYWTGAASLSQLAMSGTSSPETCKFPEEVECVELLQAIEILDVSEKAKKSIQEVKIWKV